MGQDELAQVTKGDMDYIYTHKVRAQVETIRAETGNQHSDLDPFNGSYLPVSRVVLLSPLSVGPSVTPVESVSQLKLMLSRDRRICQTE